jgi:hypothetical protein
MSFTQIRPRKSRITFEDIAAARQVLFRLLCSLMLAAVFISLLM